MYRSYGTFQRFEFDKRNTLNTSEFSDSVDPDQWLIINHPIRTDAV